MDCGKRMARVTRTVDRLRRGEGFSSAAWFALAAAMLISTALNLWYGRHAWFSIDEAAWISDSPDLDLSGMLEPHVGHLVLVPRLVYKAVLTTVGIDYLTFRLLTIGAVLLTAALFFIWARRRVPDFIALAGALPILLFSYDPLHLLAGNGFTVMFALACGLAALIAWDRRDWKGDVAALTFLILGVATYTVALPFAVGLAVASLLERSRGRRVWVGLLPIVLYVLWRALGDVSGSDPAAGGSDWTNLVLLPAWTFQGVGGVLASWSGLNFDFATGDTLAPSTGVGPALALAALTALGWRIFRGGAWPGLWIAIAIALALFAAQTLAWGGIVRYPEMPRYLYPGLIVVLLVAVEAARGLAWSRTAFVILWLVTGVSMLTAFALLREKSDLFELRGQQTRAEITAVSLLDETADPPPLAAQPRLRLTKGFEPGSAATYGYLGFGSEELEGLAPRIGNEIDRFLATTLSLRLETEPGPVALKRCRPAHPVGNRYELALPPRGAVITSPVTARIGLGRFGSGRNLPLGTVDPGATRLLELHPDSAPTRWFITSDVPGPKGCALAGPDR